MVEFVTTTEDVNGKIMVTNCQDKRLMDIKEKKAKGQIDNLKSDLKKEKSQVQKQEITLKEVKYAMDFENRVYDELVRRFHESL